MSIKKWRREVERVAGEFGGVVHDPSGRNCHFRITLPNGRKCTAPATPSDRRGILNLRSQLRRISQI